MCTSPFEVTRLDGKGLADTCAHWSFADICAGDSEACAQNMPGLQDKLDSVGQEHGMLPCKAMVLLEQSGMCLSGYAEL